MDVGASQDSQHQSLNTAPPRPPRQGRSVMQMATDNTANATAGIDMNSPAILVMKAMGETKNSLLKLASMLPNLSQGIQQILSGLEAVVPQEVADMIAGNPPGSSGSGLGAPGVNQAPTAPPVQSGMP